MSSQAAGRRRSNVRQYSAEDQALNMISKEAEARLAAKRAARAEAREIRMKEIEKQQKSTEDTQDRVYELTNEHAAVKIRQQITGSRRGSVESNDSTDGKEMDFKAEVRELEEKYKAAMMTSAQLDNEKQSLVYQVELLKDQLEEQDEGYTELQREYKDKCREYELQKRDLKSMEHELSILKQQLELKDRLIQESGFVIMANDKGEAVLEKQSSSPSAPSSNGPLPTGAFLVSPETKEFLERAGDGTLGTPVVSNITDKFVVSSNTSDDQTCNKSQESSESPITTTSSESQMEMGVYKSVNNDSTANAISIEGSSDKAEEELHEKVDKKDCIALESKHVDGVDSTLRSEIHPGEENCKTESKKSIELGGMNLATSPGCPSSLADPVSNVEKSDPKCEIESDENDEFFDSVTSPVEKTNPIPILDKVNENECIAQDFPTEVQLPIANVTTAETSTDELIKIDAGSPGQADKDAENNIEILDNIQGKRGCEGKTEDNSKIIQISQSDVGKGTDSDSSVLNQTESESNSKEMKSSSNETFNEKAEIAMVSEITSTIEKDMNDIGLADVAEETHSPLNDEMKDRTVFGTEIPLEKSGMGGEEKKTEDLHDTLFDREKGEKEDIDKTAEIAADEEDLVIREDEIIEGTEKDSVNLSMNDDKKVVSPEIGLKVDVKEHSTVESYEVVGVDELETAVEHSTIGKEKDVAVEQVQKETLKEQIVDSAKSLEGANMEQKLSADKEENLELKIDESLDVERLDPKNLALGEQNGETSNTEGQISVVEKVDSEQLNDKSAYLEENLSIPLNKNLEGHRDDLCVKNQHDTADVKVSDLTIVKPLPSVEDSGEGGYRKPQDLMDRTTSLGGESQYSEGGIIDDYDLDDINDILNSQEDATAKSNNPAEGQENSEVRDETICTGESNTDKHMGSFDTSKDGNGSEKCDSEASKETEAIIEDQAYASAETMKKAESQDPLEPEDLEQALDLKMKEKSKKKSKRFSLFRKVFK